MYYINIIYTEYIHIIYINCLLTFTLYKDNDRSSEIKNNSKFFGALSFMIFSICPFATDGEAMMMDISS